MDFAADAVMDAIPPPSARPSPAAQRPPPGERFDDHLDAANAEDAPERVASDKPDDAKSDAPVDASAQAATQPAATPPQSAAAIILQMIGNTAAPPTDTPTETDAPAVQEVADGAPPPQAPVKAKQELPTFTPEAGGEEQPTDAAIDQAPAIAPKAEPRQVQHAAAPAPEQAPAPVQQQAAQTQTPPTAAPTAPAQTAQPIDEQAQAALAALGTATPERPAPRPAAPQSGKTQSSEGNAKSDASDAKAFEQAVNEKARGAGQAQHQPQQGKADAVTAFNANQAQQLEQPAQTQQLLPLTASSTSATHAQHAIVEQSAARAAPAASQVAREIVRQFDGENTRFELRLDPPELGRVEVRLEVSRDHKVTAIVAADSPQALAELARHARELEQTLQSAGLELSDNGLSFDLRQSRDEANNEDAGGGGRNGENANTNDALSEAPVTARPIGFERWRGVRIDVTV